MPRCRKRTGAENERSSKCVGLHRWTAPLRILCTKICRFGCNGAVEHKLAMQLSCATNGHDTRPCVQIEKVCWKQHFKPATVSHCSKSNEAANWLLRWILKQETESWPIRIKEISCRSHPTPRKTLSTESQISKHPTCTHRKPDVRDFGRERHIATIH